MGSSSNTRARRSTTSARSPSFFSDPLPPSKENTPKLNAASTLQHVTPLRLARAKHRDRSHLEASGAWCPDLTQPLFKQPRKEDLLEMPGCSAAMLLRSCELMDR